MCHTDKSDAVQEEEAAVGVRLVGQDAVDDDQAVQGSVPQSSNGDEEMFFLGIDGWIRLGDPAQIIRVNLLKINVRFIFMYLFYSFLYSF